MIEVSFFPPLCLLFLLRSSSSLAHAHISLWDWSNASWPEDTFPPSSKNDVIFFAFTSFPPPQMNTHLSGCSRGSQADIKNFLEESFPISLLVKPPASCVWDLWSVLEQHKLYCKMHFVYGSLCSVSLLWVGRIFLFIHALSIIACLFIALSR